MKKLALSSTLAIVAITALMLAPRSASAHTAVESFKKVRAAMTTAAAKGEITVKATADMKGTVTTEVARDGVILTGFPIDVKVDRKGDVLDVEVALDLNESSFQVIRYGKDRNTLELIRKEEPEKLIKVQLDPKTSSPTKWSEEPIRVQGFPITIDENGNVKRTRTSTPSMTVHIRMNLGQTATATILPSK